MNNTKVQLVTRACTIEIILETAMEMKTDTQSYFVCVDQCCKSSLFIKTNIIKKCSKFCYNSKT